MLDHTEKDCPVCGKRFTVLYPEIWAYRTGYGKESPGNKGRVYYCSWGCLQASRKGYGKDGEMMRMKKDGTPAQKPGPKQGARKRDSEQAEKPTEIRAEKIRPNEKQLFSDIMAGKEKMDIKTEPIYAQLPIMGVQSMVISEGEYRRFKAGMGFTSKDMTIVLPAEKWIGFIREIRKAMEMMGIREE